MSTKQDKKISVIDATFGGGVYSSSILEEFNVVTKHIKPTQKAQGSIKQIAYPIAWSKLMHYIDESKSKARCSFVIDKKKKTISREIKISIIG